MPGELTGQVAIITGGGRGFGKAIAERFAAAGAAVTVTARTRSQLEQTVAQITDAGARALAVAGDVTQRQDVARVVDATVGHFGPVTLMVNNAGVPSPYGPIGVVDPDEWWATQAVHVRGTLLYSSAVLPGMVRRGGGRIINVASLAGQMVQPSLSAYCVAKSTQIRLTEHIAAEGRERGIFAFAIEPGTVATDLADSTLASAEARRWLPQMIATLEQIRDQQHPAVGLARCAALCVELASGRCDRLSGRYLTPEDDLAALNGSPT